MRFGREIQIPTIHRAILGSYERFLVLLLEQFKGVLPIWLSPVQVNIIPVNNEAHYSYCKELMDKLLEEDIRVEIDNSEETLNKKIKVSNDMKNPYTVVVGNKEIENNSVSFRKLGSREQNVMKINEFINMIKDEIMQGKQI